MTACVNNGHLAGFKCLLFSTGMSLFFPLLGGCPLFHTPVCLTVSGFLWWSPLVESRLCMCPACRLGLYWACFLVLTKLLQWKGLEALKGLRQGCASPRVVVGDTPWSPRRLAVWEGVSTEPPQEVVRGLMLWRHVSQPCWPLFLISVVGFLVKSVTSQAIFSS